MSALFGHEPVDGASAMYEAGTNEAAADELASKLAYDRVFGWDADNYATRGEQDEEFKRLRRLAVPKLVDLARDLINE